MHSIGGKNPYPKPFYKQSEKDQMKEEETVFEQMDKHIDKHINWRNIEIYNPGDKLNHPEGFSLIVAKSKIDHPDSGYGVILDGRCLPGTVIGFYPGAIYYPNNVNKISKDNEYMIRRYDSVVIDGRPWDRKAEMLRKQLARLEYVAGGDIDTQFDKLKKELKKYMNPFAIGNYINHPPAGSSPNVVCHEYDFPRMAEPLRDYIPNFYAEKPSMFNRSFAYMQGMAIIARTEIVDEELYLNYRFNPANPNPSWYVQPDEEEAKRVWSRWSLLDW